MIYNMVDVFLVFVNEKRGMVVPSVQSERDRELRLTVKLECYWLWHYH